VDTRLHATRRLASRLLCRHLGWQHNWPRRLGRLRALSSKADPLEVKILAFDPGPAPAPGEVEQTSLSDLLRRSDIVSLHATPTSQNRHLINQAAFELMKPGALLINTARAWLVDTNALLQVLKSGRLGGAALDVYDLEPPDPNDPLFRQDHVIVTPHTLRGLARA